MPFSKVFHTTVDNAAADTGTRPGVSSRLQALSSMGVRHSGGVRRKPWGGVWGRRPVVTSSGEPDVAGPLGGHWPPSGTCGARQVAGRWLGVALKANGSSAHGAEQRPHVLASPRGAPDRPLGRGGAPRGHQAHAHAQQQLPAPRLAGSQVTRRSEASQH